MCSFELFVYLYLYSLVLSVRLSGTVGFFLLFLLVSILYCICVLPEWQINILIMVPWWHPSKEFRVVTRVCGFACAQ